MIYALYNGFNWRFFCFLHCLCCWVGSYLYNAGKIVGLIIGLVVPIALLINSTGPFTLERAPTLELTPIP